MQQARNEGSLLASLSELRAIEQQRLADEQAARDRARAAEAAAKAEAERTRIEAADAKLRAEREAQLQLEASRVAAEREGRLRVEAVEAAERARHQAELEHQRLQQEMDLRRAEVAKKRPTWMLAVTGFAVVAGLALAAFAYQRSQAAADANQAEQRAVAIADHARKDAEESRARVEQLSNQLGALSDKIAATEEALKRAQTDADRKRLADQLAQQRHEEAAVQQRLADARHAEEIRKRNEKIDTTKCSGQALGCIGNK